MQNVTSSAENLPFTQVLEKKDAAQYICTVVQESCARRAKQKDEQVCAIFSRGHPEVQVADPCSRGWWPSLREHRKLQTCDRDVKTGTARFEKAKNFPAFSRNSNQHDG